MGVSADYGVLRYALESRGMKVIRSRAEYMCVNEKTTV